jgi:sugar O-acyltransferase (sialic acid O-acetyltransferase NeuD family)
LDYLVLGIIKANKLIIVGLGERIEMRVVFYGASGHSYAIVYVGIYLFPKPLCEPVAYIDDDRGGCGERLEDVPIISFDEWRNHFFDVACIINVANPRSRRSLVQKIISAGGRFARLYDRKEFSFPGVSIGAGTVVAPTYIGPNTVLGEHVQVMPMCSIGHDVRIQDYVTLCPSCTVSGYVVIEEDVFVGAGATIVNGTADRPLIVGSGTKISAGAVVTKSTPPNAILAGNPARPLRELARAKKNERITP